MENQKPPPIAVGPQEGQSISMVGDTYRIMVTGKQTGNAFASKLQHTDYQNITTIHKYSFP